MNFTTVAGSFSTSSKGAPQRQQQPTFALSIEPTCIEGTH